MTVIDTPIDIARYRLAAQISCLEMEVKFPDGPRWRSLPPMKVLIAEYDLPAKRTRKDVLQALKDLRDQVEAGEAYYEIRDGICHFRYYYPPNA